MKEFKEFAVKGGFHDGQGHQCHEEEKEENRLRRNRPNPVKKSFFCRRSATPSENKASNQVGPSTGPRGPRAFTRG